MKQTIKQLYKISRALRQLAIDVNTNYYFILELFIRSCYLFLPCLEDCICTFSIRMVYWCELNMILINMILLKNFFFFEGNVWVFRARPIVQFFNPTETSTYYHTIVFNCAFITIIISYVLMGCMLCDRCFGKGS